MLKPLILGAALLTSMAAFADHGHGRGHHDNYGDEDRDEGNRHGRGHAYGHNKHHGDAREHRGERYRIDVYQHPIGYAPRHWQRGERLPPGYYAQPYIIAEYRNFRLAPPPRGYRWIRVDGDALLVAVTTGIVSSLVYDIFQ